MCIFQNYRSFQFLILTIFLAFTYEAQTQPLRFERLDDTQVLPATNAGVLFQDSKGFIWIGGLAGLFRYDGYEVVLYTKDPKDSLSIGDTKVNTITEDQKGNLWIGTHNGLNYFDWKTETFKRFFQEPDSVAGLADNFIRQVFEEEPGKLLVITNSTTSLFNPESRVIKKLELPRSNEIPLIIHKSQNGTIWFGTNKGLLKYNSLNPKNFQITPFSELDADFPEGITVYSIAEDASGTLWLGTNNGIIKFNQRKNTSDHYPLRNKDFIRVLDVEFTRNGLLWCGTSNGLVRFYPDEKNGERIQYRDSDLNNQEENAVFDLLEDRSGIIWLVPAVQGIYLFNPLKEEFKRFSKKRNFKVKSPVQIRSFLEISPGKLLLWETEGLVIYDWRKRTKEPFPYRPTWNLDAWNTGVYCFLKDNKGRLWFGTLGGVFVFDTTTTSFTHYHVEADPPYGISSNIIRDIYQDQTGAVWIATWNAGVNCILEEKGEVLTFFDTYDGSLQNAARRIFEDRKGTIWVGTRGGLLKYDRQNNNNEFKRYFHKPDDPNSLSENTAFDIYEDDEGFLWIGTYGGGLNKFDPIEETFTHFTTKDGLPDNNVNAVLPDGQGNLWLSTFSGIAKFNPDSSTFTNFTSRDGLLNSSFWALSFYQSPFTGEIFFGGEKGIDIFHPDSIRIDSTPPIVQITDFLVFNKSVPISRGAEKPDKDDFQLSQSIIETKKLAIPYRLNTITFKFTALHFANPKKNRYAYRLEGFDKEWQHIGTRRTATFTNLSPGKYRFSVKAANADGQWNEPGTSIDLIITPPWWLTWWAYLLYLIAILAAIYAFLRYQRRRLRLQADLVFQQREAQRLQELDTVKNQLYTNITHEFRTPLTVILGLTDEIPGYHQKEETGRLVRAIDLVRRNSRKLLQLIGQMLDLAKLETGKVSLNLRQGDVIAFLKYLTESYESLADSKNIELTFTTDPEVLMMDYDEEKLNHIFANLASNALKFTQEGGAVTIRISTVEELEGHFLCLEVSDTGIGIPSDKLPHIFDRFYQVDASSSRPGEGTGIGLTLTKELVELHKGKIEVISEAGKGTCFTVQLPARNDSPLRDEAPSSARLPEPAVAIPATSDLISSGQNLRSEEGLPTLLVVEDSPDIIAYLESCLLGRYELLTAANGRLGFEKALETVPDIIISDVMMPEMDGFELTEKLKTDPRTSHIPVILLTAKATLEDRLAGLKRGADAYLPKPFNKEELLIRLEKLIELRQKLQERYATFTSPPATEDPALQLEDEFVQKVRQLIEDNLGDASFGVNDIATAVHLSRTQVHRKLKALTGKSAGQFIRAIRLKRAMELLKAGPESIKAVAYDVGFTDPAYFSRVFAEEFGEPPSAFGGE